MDAGIYKKLQVGDYMEFTFTKGKITREFNGDYEINLVISKQQQNNIEALNELLSNDKIKEVKIGNKRKKRSLDANAALWKMLSMMADKLHTTKDELYLEMLDRYGVFTFIVVKPNVVDRVKEEWKTVRELGEVTINGKTGIQLQCFFGSSTYDSKEFSVLLEGVIEEAAGLGISFISKQDQLLMIEEWGKKNDGNMEGH